MDQYNINFNNTARTNKKNDILMNFWPLSIITPIQLLIILILFIPILYSAYLSFFSYSWGTSKDFIGLNNYLRMFNDVNFWRSFINTLIFVNIIVYVEIIISLGIAHLFVDKLPFKKILISIVMAPYAISPVVGVLIWRFMLEPDIGIVNYILLKFGLEQILYSVSTLHAFAVIILLSLWRTIPFTFILLYSAILAIPKELPEAASIDGANKLQVFQNITWPFIRPIVIIAIIFRYVFAFRTFEIPWILTRGGPLRTTELLSIYLYKYGFRYYELGYASATACVMVIITLLLSTYYIKISFKRKFSYE